jgi:hypothetical protein
MLAVVVGSLLVTGCGSGRGPVVAVVGDSITVISAPGVEAELRGYSLYMRAVDGKRIDEMVPLLRAEMQRKPRAVIVNLGTNDALQAQTHPDWLTGFNAVWGLTQSRPCVVFVTVSTNADYLGKGKVAVDINDAIRGLASEHHNVRVVDWNTAVHADKSLLASRNPPTDNIHPYSSQGWRWLGNHYRSALLACGVHPD